MADAAERTTGAGGERCWWGWGRTAEQLDDAECAAYGALLPGLRERPRPVPALAELALPAPRITPPAALADTLTDAPGVRAAHTYGKAYRDVVRALAGDLAAAPDLVAHPRDEAGVVDVLDWAGREGVAVVPYGGGSSVVGGVEYRGDAHRGVVSLDLSRLDRVLEVDSTDRAARIQAGTLGPAVEAQLRPYGYTLRHFPQSFEFSTVGGWLATRAGGHYATLHTHIDDFVESLRVVTPAGTGESWRLPGSGAGPSPDRFFLGSEGALGVITEAWLRVQERPRHKASATVRFADFHAALAAVRAVAQSGLHPANCRLLDPGEALLAEAGDGRDSVLVLGFESAGHPVDAPLAEAVALARGLGGRPDAPAEGGGAPDAAAAWRSAFLRMPYVRDAMARMGAVVETFETAALWSTAPALIEDVRRELARAAEEVCGAPALVNCRLTHVYPDGCAPYFTVVVPGRAGAEVAQWDQLKAAAGEILHRHRATVTHHHAVGRDHRPWYDRQRPDLFAEVLRAAKGRLDPHGILNPGVLVD